MPNSLQNPAYRCPAKNWQLCPLEDFQYLTTLEQALQTAIDELQEMSDCFDWLGTGSNSAHAAYRKAEYDRTIILPLRKTLAAARTKEPEHAETKHTQ